MIANEHTRDWRIDCHCATPLVKYSNGYRCVGCNPHVLAPCPVCKQRVTSQDHRHSADEVWQGKEWTA
jgi:hypothetical protein